MPKLKTNRAAAKRFKFTKNGKIKCGSASMRHNLSRKNAKRKRMLGGTSVLDSHDVYEVVRLMPYGVR